MTAARNLALEALRQLDRSLQFTDWENGEGEEIGAQLRAAVAALEAETGEPAAWIDPRDLAVLACPGVKEFGAMRYAGVSGAQNSKSTTPLYTAPPLTIRQKPYAWSISSSLHMWVGDYSEENARAEATRCGGTCEAFPLYRIVP